MKRVAWDFVNQRKTWKLQGVSPASLGLQGSALDWDRLILGQKTEKLPVTNSLPGIKEKHNYSEKEAALIQPHFTRVRTGISSGLTLEKHGQGFNFFPFGTKSAEMLQRKMMKKCLFLHTFLLTGFCLCNAWVAKGQAEEQKFYSRKLELKNPVDELWDY